MSEKTLNDVIRNLRVAREHLELSITYANTNLHDNNVSTLVHATKLNLSDVIDYLDNEYRVTHFRKKIKKR